MKPMTVLRTWLAVFVLVAVSSLSPVGSAQSQQQPADVPAAISPDAQPATNVNAPGTYGEMILDGDAVFYRSGVLLRSKADRPYILAQPTTNGGFAVAAAPGQERFVVQTGGNVGVGTIYPAATLHVQGGAGSIPFRIHAGSTTHPSGINPFGMVIHDINMSRPWSDGLLMSMQGNSAIEVSGLEIGAYGAPRVSSTFGDLLLAAPAGKSVAIGTATAPTKLVVTGNSTINGIATVSQDVVIGASGQSAKLVVAGNGTSTFSGPVTIDGDLKAKVITGTHVINAIYRDVAEWVDTDETLSDGTVVIVAPNKPDQVVASHTAYDTRVAGVISPEPGVLLGIPGEGRVKVATTGRVKVRVDASVHPIEIGDLLVSSGTSGVAMKSTPLDLGGVPIHRPGTLIGKALEPLASGQGEILVLLSLQ